jgi:hypothetical protein
MRDMREISQTSDHQYSLKEIIEEKKSGSGGMTPNDIHKAALEAASAQMKQHVEQWHREKKMLQRRLPYRRRALR